jgi:hypothetical protein
MALSLLLGLFLQQKGGIVGILLSISCLVLQDSNLLCMGDSLVVDGLLLVI